MRRAPIRLLARTDSPDIDATTGIGDYTNNPRRALDLLPALEHDDLEQLTYQARRIERIRRAMRNTQRHRQPYAHRIERAKAQARRRSVDIRRQLFELHRAMQTGRSEACIERRLQTLERHAFD